MTIVKWILGPILLFLTAVVGIVFGLVAFLLLAFVITHPLALGIVAVVVGGLVTGGLVHLVGRWFARKHRRRMANSIGVVTALLLLVAGGIFLYQPHGFEEMGPVDRTGVRFESLTTGSRLACRIIPARTAVRRGGVIFVHGGPGASAVTNAPFIAALSPLADEGFDVCLYDQIGSGLSARLAEPADYTAARQVADLEALRDRLGWERPVLIGESWGAQLIARYANEYPQGISAAVLVSPGPLRMGDWTQRETGKVGDRLTDDQEQAFNDLLDARIVTAMLLLRINPQTAIRFLPEPEAEGYGSAILVALSPGAVCDPSVLPDQSQPFFNLWVAQMTMLSLKREAPDHLDGLVAAGFPVLVLRGDCDYAREEIAKDYVKAFPRAELLSLVDTGHFMLLENPQEFLVKVRTFLSEQEGLPGKHM